VEIVVCVIVFIMAFHFVKVTLLFCLAINTSDLIAKIGLSIAVRESSANKPHAFIIKENTECKHFRERARI